MPPKKNKDKEQNFFNEYFEKEMTKFVDSRIKENIEKDSSEIVSTLFPYIDKVISDKIKEHIQFLGETLIKTFKQE